MNDGKKQFYCNVDEWYLARNYAAIKFGSGKRMDVFNKKRKALFKSVPLLILALLSVIYATDDSIILYGLALGFSIIGIFMLINSSGIRRLDWLWLNPPTNNHDAILLYELTDEGIAINLYNNDDPVFVTWEQVNIVSIDSMEHRKAVNSQPKREAYQSSIRWLKRDIRWTKKYKQDFIYDDVKLKHEDKQSLLVFSKVGNRINHLPIPPSWESNGRKESIIHEIKQHTRYLEKEERYQLLANVFQNAFTKDRANG